MITSKHYVVAAGLGSLALMIGALGFQYIGEMPPCKLCYWQRYPHIGAIVISVLFVLTGLRLLLPLGALSALGTAAIGGYHTGVENKWWQGPTSCTSSDIGGLSADELLSQIMSAPLVRCDEIPWSFLNLSMASWNMIVSLFLLGLWMRAYNTR